MNNTQKVTVELTKSGKLKLAEGKTDDLNPKALMLYAAAQCAGMTIVSILKRDKIMPKTFEMTVEGVLNTPVLKAESLFRSFNISYNVDCKSIADQNIVSAAIIATHDKHCGVIEMLRHIAPVAREIAIVSTETIKA